MAYRCSFCGDTHSHVWRCRDCGKIVCDLCSKGGKPGKIGIATRVYFGVGTMGLTELGRAGYRKLRQKCPSCEGNDLIRI